MGINKLAKKHDPLARKFLSDITIAKEFLSINLAPELLAKCNMDTLQIESGSYVEDDLAVHCSDILYRVDLKENKGCAYIYCLVEHQSSSEKLMPFRTLKYQLAIIQKYLDNNNKATQLPIVAALVLYNSKETPYPYYLDIAQLFADHEAYIQAPLGRFQLVDLTVTDDNEILQHGKLALLEILLKHIRARDFSTVIDTLITALKIAHDSGISHALMDGAFSYLMGGREVEDIKKLIVQIDKEMPDLKEDIMTYAEELIKQGEQRGIQLGEQRGMQLGKQETQQEIAKELIKSGVDRNIIAKATHLTLEEINSFDSKK